MRNNHLKEIGEMISKTQVGKAVGRHIYGNLYGCDREKINNPGFLKRIIVEAVEVAKAKLVKAEAYKIGGYVAAIAIVKESHISVHAWPDHSYATVDVFTCGDTDPQAAFEFIAKQLKPRKYTKHFIDRSN